MAQGDHTRSYSKTGIPVRRTTDVDATDASTSAGLGLAVRSVLFDSTTLGYQVDNVFTVHIIQCTVGSGTWTVKGYGPAGVWETLQNYADNKSKTAQSSGGIWKIDSRGMLAIGVEFSHTGGKASIASYRATEVGVH